MGILCRWKYVAGWSAHCGYSINIHFISFLNISFLIFIHLTNIYWGSIKCHTLSQALCVHWWNRHTDKVLDVREVTRYVCKVKIAFIWLDCQAVTWDNVWKCLYWLERTMLVHFQISKYKIIMFWFLMQKCREK